jgi:hypothetical protein
LAPDKANHPKRKVGKSTQLSGLISQDMLFDEPGTGVTTESSGKWSTGRVVGSYRPGGGGDFGKGPALEKNESGRGYHVKGAPGFRG